MQVKKILEKNVFVSFLDGFCLYTDVAVFRTRLVQCKNYIVL